MNPVTSINPARIGPQTPAPASAPRGGKGAQETAREFEAVFLGQMTQIMFENVQQGEFSGGAGEDMFRGVLAEKVGKEIAARGGIGIAPMVMDQIIKLQGGKPE